MLKSSAKCDKMAEKCGFGTTFALYIVTAVKDNTLKCQFWHVICTYVGAVLFEMMIQKTPHKGMGGTQYNMFNPSKLIIYAEKTKPHFVQ